MENFGLDQSEYSRNGVSKFGLDSAARPVNTTVNTRLQNKKTSATSFSGTVLLHGVR
jgi:hypothetical protein